MGLGDSVRIGCGVVVVGKGVASEDGGRSNAGVGSGEYRGFSRRGLG